LPAPQCGLPPRAGPVAGAPGGGRVHRRGPPTAVGRHQPAHHGHPPMKAITRRLERPVDLVAFAAGDGYLFLRDGVGLAGRGVAARVGRDEIGAALAAIAVDGDGAGRGPVAFGALPFLPGAPGELVVPAAGVRRAADGSTWLTTIDGADMDLTPASPPRATG